jgi:FKBP-type peptidyl-prolyl cis-trans isomerase
MKKTIVLLISVIFITVFITSCDNFNFKGKTTNKLETQIDTISYLIGVDVANNLETNKIDFVPEMFLQGMIDGKNKEQKFTDEQMQEILMKFQQELQMKQQEEVQQKSATNIIEGSNFLKENKTKPGVVETESGLQYKVIKEGTGRKPIATSEVTVHYEGKLINGEIFDSSYERGETISFALNQVIPGWTEGLQLMKEGSIYELYVPSDLGYGDRDLPNIPAGSVLIFKVELFSFE